jgi:hypothetical protein
MFSPGAVTSGYKCTDGEARYVSIRLSSPLESHVSMNLDPLKKLTQALTLCITRNVHESILKIALEDDSESDIIEE